jgi:hypothetical protein
MRPSPNTGCADKQQTLKLLQWSLHGWPTSKIMPKLLRTQLLPLLMPPPRVLKGPLKIIAAAKPTLMSTLLLKPLLMPRLLQLMI